MGDGTPSSWGDWGHPPHHGGFLEGGPQVGWGFKANKHPELCWGPPQPLVTRNALRGRGSWSTPQSRPVPPKLVSAPIGVRPSSWGAGGLLRQDLFHATAWGAGGHNTKSAAPSPQEDLGWVRGNWGCSQPPISQGDRYWGTPWRGRGCHLPSPSSRISCTSSSSSTITTQSSPLSL